MKKWSLLVIMCALLSTVACAPLELGAKAGPESIKAPPVSMEKWNEWKFGLFIHWGPWSQMGIGPIFRGRKGEDIRTAEEVQKFLDLNKSFNPEKFDPRAWARVAKKAGMRYVVFTTKHHDGFCNFDTKLTDYKVTSPDCPYSRSDHPDITANLIEAFRREGLTIGLYYSHPDQHHPDGVWWRRHLNYIEDFVTKYPNRWRNFVEFEKGQVRELLTNYGKIDILWYDISWPTEGLRDAVPMLKMVRKLQPHIIIDNRGTSEYADFDTPEQRIPAAPPEGYWETNMTISGTGTGWSGYWYKGPDAPYKSSEDIVHKLADIASKGGNFLLNVGPKADGTLAQGEIDCLLGVGKWMDVNGEAIYGTKRSPWGAAPPWGRITIKGNRLYLIVFDWARGGTLPLALKKGKIVKATLLKNGKAVPFKANAAGDGVEFALTGKAPSEYASVIAVDFKGDLDVTAQWPAAKRKRKK